MADHDAGSTFGFDHSLDDLIPATSSSAAHSQQLQPRSQEKPPRIMIETEGSGHRVQPSVEQPQTVQTLKRKGMSIA